MSGPAREGSAREYGGQAEGDGSGQVTPGFQMPLLALQDQELQAEGRKRSEAATETWNQESTQMWRNDEGGGVADEEAAGDVDGEGPPGEESAEGLGEPLREGEAEGAAERAAEGDPEERHVYHHR